MNLDFFDFCVLRMKSSELEDFLPVAESCLLRVQMASKSASNEKIDSKVQIQNRRKWLLKKKPLIKGKSKALHMEKKTHKRTNSNIENLKKKPF